MLIDTIGQKTKIIINESFNTFNDGYFQIQLFSNSVPATLDKTMNMNTRTFEKLCRM